MALFMGALDFFTQRIKNTIRFVAGYATGYVICAIAIGCIGSTQTSFASISKSKLAPSVHRRAASELMRVRKENPRIRQLGTLSRKTYRKKLQKLRQTNDYLEQKFVSLNESLASLKEAKVLASYAEAKSSHRKVAFVDLGEFDVSPTQETSESVTLYLSPESKIVVKHLLDNHFFEILDFYSNKTDNDLHLHHRHFSPANIRRRIQKAYKNLSGGDINMDWGILYEGKNRIKYQSEEKVTSEILNTMDTKSKPLNAAIELQRARKVSPKSRQLGTTERALYKAQLAKVRLSEPVIDSREKWIYDELHSMIEFKELLEYMELLPINAPHLELDISHEEIKEILPKNSESDVPKQLYNHILSSLYQKKRIFSLERDGTISVRLQTGYDANEIDFRDVIGIIHHKEAVEVLKAAIRRLYDRAVEEDI